jgi:two-component system, cell cycle sensor histidine kinase and response regulator CckA
MRVLVADDESGIRRVIRSVLAMEGYEALDAKDGLEALELARQFPCDLLITDLIMPGMDGVELIARLTAEQYPARYLLISGYGLKNGEAAGVPFLAKPFTVRQLVEAVNGLLASATEKRRRGLLSV